MVVEGDNVLKQNKYAKAVDGVSARIVLFTFYIMIHTDKYNSFLQNKNYRMEKAMNQLSVIHVYPNHAFSLFINMYHSLGNVVTQKCIVGLPELYIIHR